MTGPSLDPRRTPRPSQPRRPDDVGIEAKVAFLKRPESYPEDAERVEVVETHMSWVFLTERHAHKLKKPVRYDYFDFRTVAARRRNCAEEVRLNRRLAPDVYIGTVPLTIDGASALHLGGFGEPVDWLVKIHRLPAKRNLQRAIEAGTVREAQVRAFAVELARFYRDAAPVAISPQEYRARFAADIEANRRELVRPRYRVPADLVERVCAAQRSFLDRRAPLLEERATGRRIVEAHGDLRPEHVFLGPRPQIIDCLEFARELRLLDPVDELSFLALECARLGAPGLGRLVFEAYAQATSDEPPEALVRFYKAYRAALRAKIAVWHLREADVREPDKWPALARTYLDLAAGFLEDLG